MKKFHGAELLSGNSPDTYITGLEDLRAKMELLGYEMTDKDLLFRC